MHRILTDLCVGWIVAYSVIAGDIMFWIMAALVLAVIFTR
jgi:hypothetical protein